MLETNFKHDKLCSNLNLAKKVTFTTIPTEEILTHDMSYLPSKKYQRAYIDLGNSETKAPLLYTHVCRVWLLLFVEIFRINTDLKRHIDYT